MRRRRPRCGLLWRSSWGGRGGRTPGTSRLMRLQGISNCITGESERDLQQTYSSASPPTTIISPSLTLYPLPIPLRLTRSCTPTLRQFVAPSRSSVCTSASPEQEDVNPPTLTSWCVFSAYATVWNAVGGRSAETPVENHGSSWVRLSTRISFVILGVETSVNDPFHADTCPPIK
jgi:hypothetical protein